MKHTAIVIAASVVVAALSTSSASAQNARTFVSGLGSDSNPCSRTEPCRTFQHAHDVTNANGEIDVIDPAGYGAIIITKSISIQGHGFSGVSASSGDGIAINASASDAVFLNGLLIDGLGTGFNGIHLTSGGTLTIVNCVVRHFTSGIVVAPSSGTTTVVISDTIASDSASFNGIVLVPTGTGTVNANISRTSANNIGQVGFFFVGAVTGTVVDSITIGNGIGFSTSSSAVMRLGRSNALRQRHRTVCRLMEVRYLATALTRSTEIRLT